MINSITGGVVLIAFVIAGFSFVAGYIYGYEQAKSRAKKQWKEMFKC